MRITELNDVSHRPRRVAVGEFDGVHLGRRRVIEGNDTVLTFEPHPLAVVRPEAAVLDSATIGTDNDYQFVRAIDLLRGVTLFNRLAAQ